MSRPVPPDLPAPRSGVSPVTYGAGMLALGAVLVLAKPRIGAVPEPVQDGDEPRGLRRLAAAARDGISVYAPTNVTDSLGRSLLIGGGALILARAFDALAGRRQ
ncbi:hypothetical protein [Pararhodobacter aggregans]